MMLLSKAGLIVNVHFRESSPCHPGSVPQRLIWETATLFLIFDLDHVALTACGLEIQRADDPGGEGRRDHRRALIPE